MSIVDNEHIIDWLPGFVLDALTETEMQQVSAHLAICPSCQAELARLHQVLDELPLAVVQSAPPPGLKRRVMQSIHARTPRSIMQVQPLPFKQKLAGFFQSRWPALSLALIIILGVANLFLWRQLSQVTRQANTPMRMVALVNTNNSSGSLGTLVMDPNGKYGTLVMDNLAALDASLQYQVWLIKGNERTSVGVFSVNSDGYASLEILAQIPLVQYDAIGITVEPAGGSPAPTRENVFHALISK
jgi:anti-sigma-K factor RskA